MSLEAYFGGDEIARQLFEAVRHAVDRAGGADLRVTKSQIAFRARIAFAWVWIPGRYLNGNVAPLVLTVGLPYRDPSPRWKEIVEPAPGRFTHHLELYSVEDVDDEVVAWLKAASTTAR